MSSAKTRAEARRKAILSRGTDRLAKLTTSGRGEDAPAYMHSDPPLPHLSSLSNFVADTPPAPDPSVWSDEQQQQLMQALMMGQMPQDARAQPKPEGNGMPLPGDNPFLAQLMAASGSPGAADGISGMGSTPPMPKPKSIGQKLLPLVHLLAMWMLLAYFVFWQEPRLHEAMGGLMDEQKDRVLTRWSALSKQAARVQVVPFFWALATVQVILHSTRLFLGKDNEPLPSLLAMAMPALPPHISTLIISVWKYIGIISMLLNDISGVIVGVGFLVWLASWFAV